MSSAETTYVLVISLPSSLFRYVMFVRIELGRLSVDGGGVCKRRLLGLGGGFPPVHMYSSQPSGSSSATSASSLSSCRDSKAEDTRNGHPLNPRVTLALAYISVSILRFCDSNERNQKMELIFEYWKQDWKTKILRNAL